MRTTGNLFFGIATAGIIACNVALAAPRAVDTATQQACRHVANYIKEQRAILADAEMHWVDGPEAALLDDLRNQVYLLENHLPQCGEVKP